MPEDLSDEQSAAIARAEKLAPLRALVDTEQFDALIQGLREQRGNFVDEALFAHITGIVTTATNLKAALAKEPVGPEPAEQEAPTVH